MFTWFGQGNLQISLIIVWNKSIWQSYEFFIVLIVIVLVQFWKKNNNDDQTRSEIEEIKFESGEFDFIFNDVVFKAVPGDFGGRSELAGIDGQK